MSTSRGRSALFYARVVGVIYLAAMALSMFSQVYVPSRLVVPGDVAATARNLVASEGLFRAGIVIDVLVFLSDVVLAWALYELLRPVDDALARLGAFLRVADAAILACATLNGLLGLRFSSGATYLKAIEPEELQALSRAFMIQRGTGLYIGFVFLGAGSLVFAYLLLRSRYIPRVLAAWGIFASALLALGALATLQSPWFAANGAMVSMVPMFLYEVPLGVWFLVRGVDSPTAQATGA
jgi:hypothetical protein